jgi:hypothetical protein
MHTVDSKARSADKATRIHAGPQSVGVNDEYRSPVDSSWADVDRWENEGGASRMQSSRDMSPSIRLSLI